MINFCIFGGHEAQLSPEKRLYVTIFGGCEVKRTTAVRQIVEYREVARNGRPPTACFVLTIFGGTEIAAPTLADEYLDLLEAVRSGSLTFDEWDRAMPRIARLGPHVASFTLFGGMSADQLPSEDQELDGIALQRHLGTIPPDAAQILTLAVGTAGAQRLAAVRQAVAHTLSAAR
jgi:hypothetical protein